MDLNDPEYRIGMEVKSLPLGDLLSHLTAFGEVVVNGESLSGQ